MTSEPEQNLPSTPSTPPTPPASPATSAAPAGAAKKPHETKPRKPLTGPTLPGGPGEAWDQLRYTAETTTQKLNDFRQSNQSPADLQKTARGFAERGREEAGKGLRALAEAAGKLADLVDRSSESTGQHSQEPRVIEPKAPDAGPAGPAA